MSGSFLKIHYFIVYLIILIAMSCWHQTLTSSIVKTSLSICAYFSSGFVHQC